MTVSYDDRGILQSCNGVAITRNRRLVLAAVCRAFGPLSIATIGEAVRREIRTSGTPDIGGYLRDLRQAGLVESERRGVFSYWELTELGREVARRGGHTEAPDA